MDRTNRCRALMLLNVLQIFLAEVFQGAQDWIGCGLTEATERSSSHGTAKILEKRELRVRRPAQRDVLEYVVHMHCADAAGNTLAAGFALAEVHKELGNIHHAGAVVHHDEATRSHNGADFRQRLVVDGHVEELLWDASSRGASGLGSFEIAAIGDSTSKFEDDLPQGYSHGNFD